MKFEVAWYRGSTVLAKSKRGGEVTFYEDKA
jgi:hypothetical protein|nr:MAG TPA: hypothetical protein [Caudoviricetes sp.]